MRLDSSTVSSNGLTYTEYVCVADAKEYQVILDCVRRDLERFQKEQKQLYDGTLQLLLSQQEVFRRLAYDHTQRIERAQRDALLQWRELPYWKRVFTPRPSQDIGPIPSFPRQVELEAAEKESTRLASRIREGEMIIGNIQSAIKKGYSQVVWVTNEVIPLAFESTKEFHE